MLVPYTQNFLPLQDTCLAAQPVALYLPTPSLSFIVDKEEGAEKCLGCGHLGGRMKHQKQNYFFLLLFKMEVYIHVEITYSYLWHCLCLYLYMANTSVTINACLVIYALALFKYVCVYHHGYEGLGVFCICVNGMFAHLLLQIFHHI